MAGMFFRDKVNRRIQRAVQSSIQVSESMQQDVAVVRVRDIGVRDEGG